MSIETHEWCLVFGKSLEAKSNLDLKYMNPCMGELFQFEYLLLALRRPDENVLRGL